jgi:hypothetical protein
MALTCAKRQGIPTISPEDASSSARIMPMLTVVADWLSTAAARARAAERDNADIQACLCLSFLGLIISLALLHRYGPTPFAPLVD